MTGYPYLPEKPNEQSKQDALINALLSFSGAITQPSPSMSATPKGGLHKFLTGFAQSVPQGIGAYGQTMKGDYDLLQQHLDSQTNRAYKDSFTEWQKINTIMQKNHSAK